MAETPSSVSQPLQTEEDEESLVATATSDAYAKRSKEEEDAGPLKLTWSFGINKDVPTHNVSDGSRKVIFYVTAHTAILHDFVANTQRLLQGHKNAITCTAVSENKRWIATGDQGKDSMVIVWDSYSCIPVRTVFNAHSGGVVAVAMSPDAKYLATLGASLPQALSIWEWTVPNEMPLHTVTIDSQICCLQAHLVFNPADCRYLMSTGNHQVVFYSWDSDKLKYHVPALNDKTFNKTVGAFSQSAFIPSTTRAMTGTSEGNAVLWDHARPDGPGAPPVTAHPMMKKALKMVRLQEAGITTMTQFDQYQVVGDAVGHVKFYDAKLCMVNWWDNFDAGPVSSLSFAHSPKSSGFLNYIPGQYPNDATIKAGQFVVPDFTVATTRAAVMHATSKGGKIDVILREHNETVHALAAHPSASKLLVGSYAGFLKLWDYNKKIVLASRKFEKHLQIHCLAFDPNGQFVAVGFTNGSLRVLDSLSLADECPPFRHSHSSILHVGFSHDSQYMATADDSKRVVVFKRSPSSQPWDYLGKYQAHHKPIQGILFGVALDSNQPQLLSLGQDRVLVEYDLQASSTDDLRLLSSDRIEQSAVPSCACWYPPVTKESFIVTTNDQFKFKLYNATTKMCRKTVLGPTYGTAACKMSVLPSMKGEVAGEEKRRYLAFITAKKIGLCIVPLDGNPYGNVALTAHPGGISNIAHACDGKFVFTSGGDDLCINMWRVNTDSLDALARLGGEGLVPFYSLLDGGREGELFSELEDYFYYAQLKHQGINTMDRREVSTKVSLDEVPGIMRALGFFPSEHEIDNMLNEAKYSEYVETGKYVTEISLGELIKLYVNHRPAFGLDPKRIETAVQVLSKVAEGGVTEDGRPAIDRSHLLELLQSRGEHITESELADHLGALFGYTADGLELDPPKAAAQIEDQLPDKVTAEVFSSNVLGFASDMH